MGHFELYWSVREFSRHDSVKFGTFWGNLLVSQQRFLGCLTIRIRVNKILNPSLWGEPVFGSIHVQDISTTHNFSDDARGSSPPDRTLVSPVSTPPHQAHGCVLGLSQIKIWSMFTRLSLVSSPGPTCPYLHQSPH